MDIRNTFQVAKDIAELAKRYENEEIGNNSQAEIHYKQFINELDMLHSKLLQLGIYANENLLEKSAVNIKSADGLSSFSKITVYYVYENEGLALVADTGFDLHLVPIEIIKYDEV